MRPRTLFEDEPPSANEDVARLRLRSRPSLSELETKGILTRDRDERVVKNGVQFDETWDEIRRGEPVGR
ncbi:hypothetical protein [Haloprofundus halobius]|uniref:hypothetical protein n=1 Tax=Haloprofundus halobius TaxID=2876194 RepID=UPI001CCED5CB|nr:hypothetical protein [Haloprofundus halobius]